MRALVLIAALAVLPPAAALAQDAAPSTPGVLLAGSGIKLLPDGTVTATDTSQRVRVQTAADGTLSWTYAAAFAAGVTPIVQATAEDASGGTDLVSVKLDGAPTNTVAKLRVTRGVRTTVPSLLLTTLNLAASPGPVWLHLVARAP